MRLHLLLAVSLFAGTACWPFDEQQPLSEMELRRESGDVRVLREGERIEVEEVLALEVGDVIETLGDSTARLRLEGDRLGEMLENSRTEVLGDASLENLAGRLLARADQPMTIVFDDVEVSGEGSLFRVDRGVATTRTAVYRGAVTMSNPGEPRLEVRKLFEATVTANDLPSATRPYRLMLEDAWDLVYLQGIVNLEEELDRLAAGLAAQLGDRKPKLGYFRALGGSKDVDVMKPYLAQPTEDLLIGFTLADNADIPFSQAFRRAFLLFRQGGTWGIAAGIMEVKPKLMLADLEDIIIATGIADPEGGGVAIFAAGDVPAPGGDRPGDGDPNDPSEPPDPDPSQPAEPSPDPTCAPDDVACQVGGLPTPLPTPTQPAAEQNDAPKPKPSPTPSEKDGLLDVIGDILDFSR